MDNMEIIKDKDDPLTEKSPPPIPLIPPTSTSTFPTAPPTHPQPSTSTVNLAAERKILQLVSILKRTASKSVELNTQNEENEQPEPHPYLPRELADICLKRQQQERAWQTRLMIYTSFYSCIDGTVASFQEGEKKETARKIQAHLRNVIPQFAASGSTPYKPEFQPQIRSSNGLVNKTMGQTKKTVIVATPLVTPTANMAPIVKTSTTSTLPSKTLDNENSWATVVRNGHKKSRVTSEIPKQTTPTELPKKPMAQKTTLHPKASVESIQKSAANSQDQRLFIRLPAEHEWRKLSPAIIREIIVSVGMDLGDVYTKNCWFRM